MPATPDDEKPDHRTKDAEKARSRDRILRVCERVAAVRGVTPEELFLTRREENRKAASARSLAMAACCATGVPLCHVARAFGRSWATVHGAEVIASRRYRESEEFRREWDVVVAGTTGSLKPSTN